MWSSHITRPSSILLLNGTIVLTLLSHGGKFSIPLEKYLRRKNRFQSHCLPMRYSQRKPDISSLLQKWTIHQAKSQILNRLCYPRWKAKGYQGKIVSSWNAKYPRAARIFRIFWILAVSGSKGKLIVIIGLEFAPRGNFSKFSAD